MKDKKNNIYSEVLSNIKESNDHLHNIDKSKITTYKNKKDVVNRLESIIFKDNKYLIKHNKNPSINCAESYIVKSLDKEHVIQYVEPNLGKNITINDVLNTVHEIALKIKNEK